MAEKMKKLYNIEFMRAVCALGILVYHFSGKVACDFKPLRTYANGNIGALLVEIFFIISGAMIYRNNKKIPSLKTYYYKRWKSIFPMFYLAYICFYLINVYTQKSFLYKDCSPLTFILTFLGLDGYTAVYIKNYYILGEWFLGAVIILYVVYPLLRLGIEKHAAVTFAIITALYICVMTLPIFGFLKSNIFSSMLSFYIGMLLEKHDYLLKKKVFFIICAAVSLPLLFWTIPIPDFIPFHSAIRNMTVHLIALGLYEVMYVIGNYITKPKPLKSFFAEAGALSYPVFLVHHKIILMVLQRHNPTSTADYWLMILINIAVTIAVSFVLKTVIGLLLKSKAYKAFENAILKKNRHFI